MVRGRGELTPKDLAIRKIISNNINALLHEQGKKQIDIHNATKIPKSTLTGYIKGTSTPNNGNIQKIADFFGVKKSQIDPRFSSDVSTKIDSNLSIDALYGQLEQKRQQKVYSYAKKQLDEQLTEEKQETEIYTLAAHAADPEHEFTDDEIEHIDTFLDQIEKKANTKNQKKKS